MEGKWSFDNEIESGSPKNLRPHLTPGSEDAYHREAREYVSQTFRKHSEKTFRCSTPRPPKESQKWLEHFLEHSLYDFGAYEDAIAKDSPFLFHSVLTPMLNIGLLTPKQVLEAASLTGSSPIQLTGRLYPAGDWVA